MRIATRDASNASSSTLSVTHGPSEDSLSVTGLPDDDRRKSERVSSRISMAEGAVALAVLYALIGAGIGAATGSILLGLVVGFATGVAAIGAILLISGASIGSQRTAERSVTHFPRQMSRY